MKNQEKKAHFRISFFDKRGSRPRFETSKTPKGKKTDFFTVKSVDIFKEICYNKR
jgi:hypothetical protein